MKDGFLKVGAASPKLRVADCDYNGTQILECIKEAEAKNVKLLVFPELCITGYTCGDLFLQDTLLKACEEKVAWLLEMTRDMDILYVVGFPLPYGNSLYNVAAFCKGGEILNIVPKTYIPNYQEFYEARYFQGAENGNLEARIFYAGQDVSIGTKHLLACSNMPGVIIAGEICEDLWMPDSPAVSHALAGATIICNPSASDELATKPAYRKNLVSMQSAKLIAGYIYADAGNDESTQDLVYSGHSMIAENGMILSESELFEHKLTIAEIDVNRLVAERRKMNTFQSRNDKQPQRYEWTEFQYEVKAAKLTRPISKTPFVPQDALLKKQRCEEILTLQAMGLRKRLEHTGCKACVLGLSGGLDSTLALLVTVKAYDLLDMPRRGIVAVTMPGFGTTDRTYQNAVKLAGALGATLKEISIGDAVRQHFKDIEQDESIHDITYENAQARERTQVLMDLANQCGGLVIGTGDMSELALGWATYNGDHMSMYGVNVSIPKTLVRYLVSWYADEADGETAAVLRDVLATPVSPELLPPEHGEIAQKTEDIVGPYELHDFFLYYMMRFGFSPTKIYRLAGIAFAGDHDNEVIKKWMKVFYGRFFSQQFKRSCMPDGPKVGTVSLSPRGDLRMPSDAVAALWLKEIEGL